MSPSSVGSLPIVNRAMSAGKPSPEPAPRVSARIAALIALRLQACGVSPDPVFRAAGLALSVAQDPDLRIPLRMEERLWDAAAEASADPLFGLHAAESIRSGRFDVLDYVIRTAATLRESLQRLARYNRLLHDVATFTLVPRGSELRVEHGLDALVRAASPHAAEFTMASLVVVGRQLLPELRVASVEFAHPRRGPASEYERVFGASPAFGAPSNAVCFPADLLDLPLPAADPVLSSIVTAHADRVLDAMVVPDEPLVAQVRRLAATTLAAGVPSLSKVARELHLSDRTLQRRLLAEGHRFEHVVEEVRRDLAMRYLADRSLALGEVAYLLGFSESSAFHRAFKRWTGTTPTAFRSARQRA